MGEKCGHIVQSLRKVAIVQWAWNPKIRLEIEGLKGGTERRAFERTTKETRGDVWHVWRDVLLLYLTYGVIHPGETVFCLEVEEEKKSERFPRAHSLLWQMWQGYDHPRITDTALYGSCSYDAKSTVYPRLPVMGGFVKTGSRYVLDARRRTHLITALV